MISIDSIRFIPFESKICEDLLKLDGETKLRHTFDDTSEEWGFGSKTIRPNNSKLRNNESWVCHEKISGMTIYCSDLQQRKLSRVQVNLSRLLTGANHNGYIIRTQAELDLAINKFVEMLRRITGDENVRGHFSSIEIGGVVEHPLSKFVSVLKDRNFPRAKKAPIFRPGESLKFGTSKTSELCLQFYDKGKQLNLAARQNPGWINKLPVNQFTRIEVKISGKKLNTEMGGPVITLDLTALRAVFFKTLYSIHSGGFHPANFGGTQAEWIALYMDNANAKTGDLSYVELWKMGRAQRHVQRVMRSAQRIYDNRSTNSLAQLIPNDGSMPFIDLDPDGSINTFLNQSSSPIKMEKCNSNILKPRSRVDFDAA